MNRAAVAGTIAGVTLAAFGAAYGVNFALGWVLALPEGASVPALDLSGGAEATDTPAPTGPVASRPSPRPRQPDYLQSILCRSLMDSSVAGQDCGPSKAGGGGTTAVVGEECRDHSVTLLGTVVAEPSTYSSALILAPGKNEAVGVGIGQEVGGVTITDIAYRKVKTNNGWLCMDEQKTVARAPQGTPSKADDGEGVNKVSDTEFEVSSDLFDKYINDMEALAGMGRALTHRGPDGKPDGYRLSAIRRNTLPDKLGIRNGDIVHSVNGMPLTSMQGAMEAYNTLQSSGQFEVEVTRRGQKQTLKYTKN